MKKNSFAASPLWKDINKKIITKNNIATLDNFKSNEINHRISLWNPQTNGIRYLKSLIYNLSSELSSLDWQKIKKIKNRDIGNPISIKYNNQDICLDYVQALFEMNFISKKFNFNNKKIIEIGVGYGRTCHSIISNYDIKSYQIVDLENCLYLSQRYLKSVLTKEQFSKISFLSNEELSVVMDSHFDIAINIDSFAEMESTVVYSYLRYIADSCSYFYTKNPVGKYLDKSLDNHSRGKRTVSNAMKTGILRQIVDINNNNSVELNSRKFIQEYCPGKKWQSISNSWAKPWSHYWQSLYKLNK
jgi:putative sugar O-methyltransferase